MEINIVDTIEFLCLDNATTNKFTSHCVRPFHNFENAKDYVFEILKSEGYSLNIVCDFISEEAFWDGNKLLDNYTFYEISEIEDWAKIQLKRYTGYKIIVNDDNKQIFKKIVITIQTEDI